MAPVFDCDLVIVGAGAAGLAAAREAARLGIDATVVEAARRLGGRAHTDVDSLPWPVDLGCHWLHAAASNPFTAAADRLGIRYLRAELVLHRGAVAGFDAAESPRLRAALDRFYAAVARTGPDVAAAEAVDPAAPFFREWRSFYAMLVAEPPERVSVRDTQEWFSEGGDWMVEDGYGLLVLRRSAGAKVWLDCPATAIDWSGPGVTVETPRGALRAAACVVTVSTGVLAAEAIRFAPRLSDALLRAIDAAPMGRAEKVHLAFDRDPFPALPHHYRLCGEGGEALAFHVKPFGRAMATLFAGGDAAGALGALPPAGRVAFARERLAAEFGGETARRVTAARPTGWEADPFVRGAYGVTRPGRFADRRGFGEAPGGRLFFAGEACSTHAFGTAHGADETGVAAARRAAAAIRGEEGP